MKQIAGEQLGFNFNKILQASFFLAKVTWTGFCAYCALGLYPFGRQVALKVFGKLTLVWQTPKKTGCRKF